MNGPNKRKYTAALSLSFSVGVSIENVGHLSCSSASANVDFRLFTTHHLRPDCVDLLRFLNEGATEAAIEGQTVFDASAFDVLLLADLTDTTRTYASFDSFSISPLLAVVAVPSLSPPPKEVIYQFSIPGRSNLVHHFGLNVPTNLFNHTSLMGN